MTSTRKTIKVYLTPELDKELRRFLVEHDFSFMDRSSIVAEAIQQFIKTGGHDDIVLEKLVSKCRDERANLQKRSK